MTNTFAGIDWEVSLPENWQGQQDDECSTLFHPNGVGVLQISSAQKEGLVSHEDLLDFAEEHVEAGAKIKEASFVDLKGFTFQYQLDDSYWIQWFLRFESIALFITYNCSIEDQGIEDSEIESILTTIRVK